MRDLLPDAGVTGNRDELILLRDLPNALIASVIHEVVNYSIAFLTVRGSGQPNDVELLGSGVLVSAAGRRAILTADHVAQLLPAVGRVGLFLDRTNQVHTIDASGISIVRIARGAKEAEGPDLAAVMLAPQIAGALAAKKVFFNLDARRNTLLNSEPSVQDGVWIAQGFLAERTTVGPDKVAEGFTKYFYNFTGIGGPQVIERVGSYDYVDFPVSHEARGDVPVSWGGMSGGGIWLVPLGKSEGVLVHLKPVLSGVMFYQHPTTPTQCGIRGHAFRSIYEKAYQLIAGI